jgi:hypothetical protein
MSLLAFWQLARLLLAGPLKPGAARPLRFIEKLGCAGPAAELGVASIGLLMQFLSELGMGLRRPLRTSCAAISRISRELWLLKKAVCGVTIRLGASFNGPFYFQLTKI